MTDLLDRLSTALADRYAFERKLGAGGMAIVYLAQDLKHKRQVAVKVLRDEVASLVSTERFMREIEVTAKLTHPNILPLHDSGAADGVLYYVMPYVEGESLRHRLNRRQRLPVDEVVRLTSEVADALSSAHRLGVIHRDIKPENILIEAGHAVVADFGIARVATTFGDHITQTGWALGTPSYMSPEQRRGDSNITPASDIYALGSVAYEMFTGSPPIVGSAADSSRVHTPASAGLPFRKERPEVPESVERAVLKALALDPSERFATAADFASALKIQTSAAGPRAKVIAASAATGILITVVLGGLGLIPGLVRPAAAGFFHENDRILLAEFENATDQPALGLAIREAVATDLEQSQYANVVEPATIANVLQRMRRPDSARLDLETALEVARREGFPAVVAGSVAHVGAGYQLSGQIIETSTGEVAVRIRETAEDDGEVLSAVERLTHLIRRHLGESLRSVRRSQPLPIVTTSSLEALQLLARASDLAGRGLLLQAIPFGRQAVDLDSSFAAAHRMLGLWYQNTGDPINAQRHANLAHHFNDRLLPRERFLVGATYHAFRGELDSAAAYYALQLDRYPNEATALNNLGDLRERMGRYDEALDLYRMTVDVVGTATAYVNAASAARSLHRHALADSIYLEMRERFPDIWFTWQAQILNAFFAGDYELVERIAIDMKNSEFEFPNAYGTYMLASVSGMRGQAARSIALADSSSKMALGVSRSFMYIPLSTAQYAAFAAGTADALVPVLDDAPRLEPLGAAPQFNYITLGRLARGYALAGRDSTAARMLSQMDSLATAIGIRPRGIGHEVRSALALNANHPEESLDHLQQAQSAEFGLLQHSARFLLARTYEALEQWSNAAAHYDSLSSTYRLNYQDVQDFAAILPMALEGAADSYLMLGDTTSAASRLASFVELWADAEPSLQAYVERARSRLAGLVTEPG